MPLYDTRSERLTLYQMCAWNLKFFFARDGFSAGKAKTGTAVTVVRGQASRLQDTFNVVGRGLLAMTLFQMDNAWWSWT